MAMYNNMTALEAFVFRAMYYNLLAMETIV